MKPKSGSNGLIVPRGGTIRAAGSLSPGTVALYEGGISLGCTAPLTGTGVRLIFRLLGLDDGQGGLDV